MADKIIFVSKSCTITLTMPSDNPTVKLIYLDGKRMPPAMHDPAVARAAVSIRIHDQR
jgi:hypothetical protein